MALKELSILEKKSIWSNNTVNMLMGVTMISFEKSKGKVNCVEDSIKELHYLSEIMTSDFHELVRVMYGESKNPIADIEYKFASILTATWLIKCFNCKYEEKIKKNKLVSNVEKQLQEHFPEYKVKSNGVNPYTYTSNLKGSNKIC